MDDFETLKNVFIFRGLSESELDSIRKSLISESVKKGEYVFWEEDPSDYLYILASGKIKWVKQSESGKDTIMMIIGPGETFGEIALFDGRPHSASAQALESSRVLKMPRADFFQFLEKNNVAQIEVIIELARRLREAQDIIKGMAAERVERRIVELLMKLAEKVGRRDEEGMRIGIVLTRQDIADMVGATVETTIRVISRLSNKGLIITRGKSIIIPDMDKMKDFIEMQEDL